MLASADVVSLVPVSDFERARAFYGEVLGLRLVSSDGFALEYDANGRPLRLTRAPPFTPQPFAILGWRVPDIEAAVAGLRERGVTFERYDQFPQDDLGIWSVPDGSAKVAWFKDPDGNLLSVVWARSWAP